MYLPPTVAGVGNQIQGHIACEASSSLETAWDHCLGEAQPVSSSAPALVWLQLWIHRSASGQLGEPVSPQAWSTALISSVAD